LIAGFIGAIPTEKPCAASICDLFSLTQTGLADNVIRMYREALSTISIAAALLCAGRRGVAQSSNKGTLANASLEELMNIEFSIGVQDALEANHVECESTRFNQISMVPRNFYAEATWRY
jgi:hypothetical protein